ncbi:MAG TPA: hypothetical protein VKW04_01610 [Planctomycetota bacterium]|nr:hypothetical protein [Planctomycetota bacterium]
MIRALLVLGLFASVPAPAQQPATRFVTVDVYATTGGRPLAAWQIELNCDPSQAKIVGVEGAGPKPPYYDPAALDGGRIILADFSTEASLPSGRVLVARVHFQETGSPVYTPTLMAAAAPGGERLEPKIDLVRAGGK